MKTKAKWNARSRVLCALVVLAVVVCGAFAAPLAIRTVRAWLLNRELRLRLSELRQGAFDEHAKWFQTHPGIDAAVQQEIATSWRNNPKYARMLVTLCARRSVPPGGTAWPDFLLGLAQAPLEEDWDQFSDPPLVYDFLGQCLLILPRRREARSVLTRYIRQDISDCLRGYAVLGLAKFQDQADCEVFAQAALDASATVSAHALKALASLRCARARGLGIRILLDEARSPTVRTRAGALLVALEAKDSWQDVKAYIAHLQRAYEHQAGQSSAAARRKAKSTEVLLSVLAEALAESAHPEFWTQSLVSLAQTESQFVREAIARALANGQRAPAHLPVIELLEKDDNRKVRQYARQARARLE